MTVGSSWARVAVLLVVLWAPLVMASGQGDSLATGAWWQEDGLLWQPRLAELEPARDYGFEPGSTAWQEAELPEALREGGWASPGALLLAAVRELALESSLGIDTWELTLRVLEAADEAADEAAGVVLEWGFKDDAVAGSDWRLAMRRGGEGWRATGLERRFHCRRGVSAGGLCL
ncbi:MAG: hypothetical protein M3498_07465 [Deinococcota bacterium]|nr:hypothetical protein [Deinococcota bacterium]